MQSTTYTEIYKKLVTDSGFLTKTLVRPIWYWSLSMLTERRRWRTPCCSGPLQHGHVSAVRMAYLDTTSVHTHQPKVTLRVCLSCVLLSGRHSEMDAPFQKGLNSPHHKLVEDSAVCISSPSYTNVFPQSKVFDLMPSPKKTDGIPLFIKKGLLCVWVYMFVTVRMLTCSPPSLSVFLSHWVWGSGYSAECISSAYSPDH